MKNSEKNRTIWLSLFIAVVSLVVAYWYEPMLPEQVPTHWNASGEVDGYTAKPWGVYMLPIMNIGLVLLLSVLPKISPNGFKLGQAKKIYDLVVLIMSVFLTAVMVLSFEAALNKDIDMVSWVLYGVGTLYIVLGNYLTKVPKNFFLGIRTPWTLASDKVWYATHRMGSWCFIVSGLVVILAVVFALPSSIYILVFIIGPLVPVMYSLYAYYKIEGFKKTED